MKSKDSAITVLTQLMGRAALASGLGKSYYDNSGNPSRDVYKSLGYKTKPTLEDYYSLYRRQDIAQRVIKAPVEACWRKKPVVSEVQGEETPFEAEIQALVKEKFLWSVLSRLDRITGLGEFGILFLGFADNKPSSEEVSSKSSLVYLRPYMQTSVSIDAWEEDPKNPRFGLPTLYSLTVWSGSSKEGSVQSKITAHHSRIIHVAEDRLETDVYGTPQLECILNRLQDLDLLAGGSAEMYWRGALPGYALRLQENAALSPTNLEEMEDEFKAYIHDLQRFIRLTGLDIDSLSPQVTDPEKQVDVIISLIAAAKGIPKRILMGSERGELASSQDERAWNDRIDSRRKDHVENNIIRPTIDRLVKYGALTPPKSGEYSIEWPDLSAPSFQEEMTTAETVSKAISTYMGTPGTESLVPAKMFLQKYLKFTSEEIEKVEEILVESFSDIEDVPLSLDSSEEIIPEEDAGLTGNFNPYHDKLGRFASAPGGGVGGGSVESSAPGGSSETKTSGEFFGSPKEVGSKSGKQKLSPEEAEQLDKYLTTKTEISPEGYRGWESIDKQGANAQEPKWHNFPSYKREHFYDVEKIRDSKKIDLYDFEEQKWFSFKSKDAETNFREKYPFAELTKPAGEVRTWYRFGKPPESFRSTNFSEGRAEAGVSVYATPSGSGGAVFFHDRILYKGEGRQVGWGSDGEPLIIPTSAWKKYHPPKNKKES